MPHAPPDTYVDVHVYTTCTIHTFLFVYVVSSHQREQFPEFCQFPGSVETGGVRGDGGTGGPTPDTDQDLLH